METSTRRIEPSTGETYEPPAVAVLGSVSDLTASVGDTSIEEPGMPVAPPV